MHLSITNSLSFINPIQRNINKFNESPAFKGIRQLATFLKIQRWAIDADVALVLPTGLRGWRTDWADFLVKGHLVPPGSAASENKEALNFSEEHCSGLLTHMHTNTHTERLTSRP